MAGKRDRFLRLIAVGVGNSEACRLVGVNRRTGTRWRYGRRVVTRAGGVVIYPPMRTDERGPRSARYLSERERVRIPDLLAVGFTIRAVAEDLGRSASTISREVRRNRDRDGRYRPHRAEHAARLRSARARPRRLSIDSELADAVVRLPGLRWSPEQVAHQLRVLFAADESRWLCKESIYQAIYDPAVAITRPARRRRRRRRLTGLERRGRIAEMRMISERPAEVADRAQAGHWEGDLIMGAGNRSAIGTLVERTTRFVMLLSFPNAIATSDAVRAAISHAFAGVPPALRRTLTWDQGKELSMHEKLTSDVGTGVFFCDAHSPWQRGSNENMNGLVRDSFPKGSELGAHTPRGDRTRRVGAQRPTT